MLVVQRTRRLHPQQLPKIEQRRAGALPHHKFAVAIIIIKNCVGVLQRLAVNAHAHTAGAAERVRDVFVVVPNPQTSNNRGAPVLVGQPQRN